MKEFDNNNNNGMRLREKLDRWLWVILFVIAVLYLKYLLSLMHFEINKLGQERQSFRSQIEEIQKENLKLYQFQAAINGSLERLIKKSEP